MAYSEWHAVQNLYIVSSEILKLGPLLTINPKSVGSEQWIRWAIVSPKLVALNHSLCLGIMWVFVIESMLCAVTLLQISSTFWVCFASTILAFHWNGQICTALLARFTVTCFCSPSGYFTFLLAAYNSQSYIPRGRAKLGCFRRLTSESQSITFSTTLHPSDQLRFKGQGARSCFPVGGRAKNSLLSSTSLGADRSSLPA